MPHWLCTCPSQRLRHPSQLCPASALSHLPGKFLLVLLDPHPMSLSSQRHTPSPSLESNNLSSSSAERRFIFETNKQVHKAVLQQRQNNPCARAGHPHAVPAVPSLDSQSVEWEGTERLWPPSTSRDLKLGHWLAMSRTRPALDSRCWMVDSQLTQLACLSTTLPHSSRASPCPAPIMPPSSTELGVQHTGLMVSQQRGGFSSPGGNRETGSPEQ